MLEMYIWRNINCALALQFNAVVFGQYVRSHHGDFDFETIESEEAPNQFVIARAIVSKI